MSVDTGAAVQTASNPSVFYGRLSARVGTYATNSRSQHRRRVLCELGSVRDPRRFTTVRLAQTIQRGAPVGVYCIGFGTARAPELVLPNNVLIRVAGVVFMRTVFYADTFHRRSHKGEFDGSFVFGSFFFTSVFLCEQVNFRLLSSSSSSSFNHFSFTSSPKHKTNVVVFLFLVFEARAGISLCRRPRRSCRSQQIVEAEVVSRYD